MLHEVHQSSRDEYAMKAGGYLNVLEKFSTYCGQLSFFVFSGTEQLSITLLFKGKILLCKKQSKHQNFICGGKGQTLYMKSVMRSQNLTEEPVLPRQRKLPRRLDSGTSSHEFESPKEFFARNILKCWE